jgi:hypothetical protein
VKGRGAPVKRKRAPVKGRGKDRAPVKGSGKERACVGWLSGCKPKCM